MPALIAALGAAFSWIVQALLAGIAGAATQKAIRFAVAALIAPLILGWIAVHLAGASPFDLGQLLGQFVGGLPGMVLYMLDSFGIIAFLFVVLKFEVGAFIISLYMRFIGAGR